MKLSNIIKEEHPHDLPPDDKAINEKIQSFIKKEIDECWKSYKQVGMKKKGNRQVPNCVPESMSEKIYVIGLKRKNGSV